MIDMKCATLFSRENKILLLLLMIKFHISSALVLNALWGNFLFSKLNSFKFATVFQTCHNFTKMLVSKYLIKLTHAQVTLVICGDYSWS